MLRRPGGTQQLLAGGVEGGGRRGEGGAPALKGGSGKKGGSGGEGCMGEGPPVREAAAGLQPRWGDGGEPCAGIGGHPEGQPGSRAPRDARTRAREAGGSPGCARGVEGTGGRGSASPLRDSPRLPAKPSILRGGTRRARGSAGRALHSAHRPSGGRGALTRSFSSSPDAAPDAADSRRRRPPVRRPPVRPGVGGWVGRSAGRSVSQPG